MGDTAWNDPRRMASSLRLVLAKSIRTAPRVSQSRIASEFTDGMIWVYGVDDDAILAFTDEGIEEVQQLLDENRHDDTTKP